jgi:TetR/AcrR family hemagglutinin/protease transcriptional regulator
MIRDGSIAGPGAIERRRASRLEKSERRAILLQTALAVFARRGIGGAHHAEIALKAKVSVPTVFFYFPTRNALVDAVLEEVARFFIEMAERIYAERRPAPEIILKHMRAFADAVDTHPNHTRVMLEWSMALRHEVWPAFLQFQERVIAMLAQTIRRWRMETGNDLDRETEDDARVIASAGYVLVQMKVAKLPDSRIERFMQTVLRDSLGDGQAPAGAQFRLPTFKVAIG